MDQLLTLITKLLFKAIKMFVNYSAWQGYFILTAEETKLISDIDAKEVCRSIKYHA